MDSRQIKSKLDKIVFGQDHVKQSILNAAKLWMLEEQTGEHTIPTNVLVTGPSGTGKTLITRSVAELLNIDMFEIDASSVTPEGYVGANPTDKLKDACSHFNVKDIKDIRGIIFLDEIDKLTSARGDKDGWKASSQGQFLKAIENTPNILWVLAGNYTEIRRTKNTIGIGKKLEEKIHSGTVSEALEAIGVSSQFLGRIRYFTNTTAFTEEEYEKIIPMAINKYATVAAKLGKKFTISKKDIKNIIKVCTKGDTGARKLDQELSTLFTKFLADEKFPTIIEEATGKEKVSIHYTSRPTFSTNLVDQTKTIQYLNGQVNYLSDKCEKLKHTIDTLRGRNLRRTLFKKEAELNAREAKLCSKIRNMSLKELLKEWVTRYRY